MDKKEIFEYLSNNLNIRIVESCGYYDDHTIKVKLLLTNPETGKEEEISSDECDL